MLSPVGALANGLELLADEQDPEMRARCMELLEQSARISTDKLKFFRLAFGAAGGFGEAIPIDEAQSVIDALAADAKAGDHQLGNRRAEPAQAGGQGDAQSCADCTGCAWCAGARWISARNAATARSRSWRARAVIGSPFDETIGRALQGDLAQAEITSRTAAAHMIALVAEELEGGLQYKLGDGVLVLGAVLPEPAGLIG